jgi:pimeloyl-ACP methyl ester carboxylesterase
MGNATVFEAGSAGWMMHFREPDRYRIRPTPPKVPALAIQGALDELKMGREVAEWLGAKMIILSGVGHVETRTDPTALREASKFIQESLFLR